MTKWECQLREQFAGDRVWSHPDAAGIRAAFESRYPDRKLSAHGNLLEFIVRKSAVDGPAPSGVVPGPLAIGRQLRVWDCEEIAALIDQLKAERDSVATTEVHP